MLKDPYEYLLSLGCCKICSLRLLNITTKEYYLKLKSFFEKENIECEKPLTKKPKENACIVCLDLLKDEFLDELVQAIENNNEFSSYDCDYFACALSLPISIQVRTYSVMFCLKQKYPEFTNETPLKEVWKWLFISKTTKMSKKFDSGAASEFLVTVNFKYKYENDEMQSLNKLYPNKKRSRNNGHCYSRKNLDTLFKEITFEKLKMYYDCPPTIPDVSLVIDNISCQHNSIYFAGRYLKFSRELSQTPWILDGKRMMESSVQELICEPIMKILNVKLSNMKLGSSGREDVDVRCLGPGRPFFIEILNSKITKIDYDKICTIENEINQSTLIQVKYLQVVNKNDINKIKEGEETKQKTYETLCYCEKAFEQSDFDKLNSIKELVLDQKTPIRVLHRRPLANRPRTIYQMIAKPVEGYRAKSLSATLVI